MPPAPVWIRTPDELAALARELAGAPAIALDTEADSLHHYPERLCLVQLGDARERVFLIDPLAVADLDPLAPLCATAETLKIFHSAENDLAHLKRRRFTFAGISDTMLAARFLGVRELGLDALLDRFLGVRALASQQKADWARRPLTPPQEAYAAQDVRYLIPLHERLVTELRAAGRDGWLVEECAALAAATVLDRPADENGYRRLRGASRLDPRGLAILQALHAQREAWARAERRPPFKVLNPETLVALAAVRPRDRAALAAIPGLSPRLVARYGAGILEAVARGLAAPLSLLSDLKRTGRPRPPAPPPVVRERIEALKRWRAGAAQETGLDPGVLLPQRLIDVLAAAPPGDTAALARVPGVRRWRAETFGRDILATLGGRT